MAPPRHAPHLVSRTHLRRLLQEATGAQVSEEGLDAIHYALVAAAAGMIDAVSKSYSEEVEARVRQGAACLRPRLGVRYFHRAKQALSPVTPFASPWTEQGQPQGVV